MAVVNRRRDALALLDHFDGDVPQVHHLSTLLCGAHRRDVLTAIRQALAEGAACHLVATQVVEAGVDIDFPMVLRALAPFDSIVQAAGRCNREGRLTEGRCIVFRPEQRDSYGSYRRGADTLRAMIEEARLSGTDVDFDEPAVCADYYRRLYGSGSVRATSVDPKNLRPQVGQMMFASIAAAYRIIDEPTETIVVLYPPARTRVERLLAAMEHAGEPARARRLLRLLQPYVVSLRPREVERARQRALLDERAGVAVWRGVYDMRTGVSAVLLDETDGDPTTEGHGGGYVI
jgi:CRISPR-associated endonuclease/helicase Cas3